MRSYTASHSQLVRRDERHYNYNNNCPCPVPFCSVSHTLRRPPSLGARNSRMLAARSFRAACIRRRSAARRGRRSGHVRSFFSALMRRTLASAVSAARVCRHSLCRSSSGSNLLPFYRNEARFLFFLLSCHVPPPPPPPTTSSPGLPRSGAPIPTGARCHSTSPSPPPPCALGLCACPLNLHPARSPSAACRRCRHAEWESSYASPSAARACTSDARGGREAS